MPSTEKGLALISEVAHWTPSGDDVNRAGGSGMEVLLSGSPNLEQSSRTCPRPDLRQALGGGETIVAHSCAMRSQDAGRRMAGLKHNALLGTVGSLDGSRRCVLAAQQSFNLAQENRNLLGDDLPHLSVID